MQAAFWLRRWNRTTVLVYGCVAFIPLAMLPTFVAGLAGMLAGNVAGWFAWPAGLLLTYMLDVVHLLRGLPHIFVENRYLSVVDMTVCYLGVVALLAAAWRSKWRRNHFSYAAFKSTE